MAEEAALLVENALDIAARGTLQEYHTTRQGVKNGTLPGLKELRQAYRRARGAEESASGGL